jgi:hypothetical protein
MRRKHKQRREQSPPGKHDKSRPQKAGTSTAEAQNPLIQQTPIDSKPYLPPAPTNHNPAPQKPYWNQQSVKFWVELAGIIGGLLGLVVLFCQLRATQEQLKEMHDQKVMDERAWMFPSDYAVTWLSNHLELTVKFKNTGKTPAFNFNQRSAQIQILPPYDEYNLPPQLRNDIPEYDTEPIVRFQGTVAPNQTITLDPKPNMPFNDFDLKTNLYIYGTVWYDDVFNQHHWTRFCARYSPDGIFSAAPFHNTCDDIATNKLK